MALSKGQPFVEFLGRRILLTLTLIILSAFLHTASGIYVIKAQYGHYETSRWLKRKKFVFENDVTLGIEPNEDKRMYGECPMRFKMNPPKQMAWLARPVKSEKGSFSCYIPSATLRNQEEKIAIDNSLAKAKKKPCLAIKKKKGSVFTAKLDFHRIFSPSPSTTDAIIYPLDKSIKIVKRTRGYVDFIYNDKNVLRFKVGTITGNYSTTTKLYGVDINYRVTTERIENPNPQQEEEDEEDAGDESQGGLVSMFALPTTEMGSPLSWSVVNEMTKPPRNLEPVEMRKAMYLPFSLSSPTNPAPVFDVQHNEERDLTLVESTGGRAMTAPYDGIAILAPMNGLPKDRSDPKITLMSLNHAEQLPVNLIGFIRPGQGVTYAPPSKKTKKDASLGLFFETIDFDNIFARSDAPPFINVRRLDFTSKDVHFQGPNP